MEFMKIANNLFKWHHFSKEIILLNLRWYLKYKLSYRNLSEMMLERGIRVNYSTIYHWVQKFSPEFNKRIRKYLKKTSDSYRVDETYIKVKGVSHYLYRALDSKGQTIDFMLSKKRNAIAAKLFFKKIFKAIHTVGVRVINVDMDKAYPAAIKALKQENKLKYNFQLRRIKFLNNIIEQDHRFIKKLVRAGMNFRSFISAEKTLAGYEAMNMVRKNQIGIIQKNDILQQNKFIESLFY